ncbi:MAG: nucleoside deaminase [Oligoflexia bacterium]|nr:nucleoside deaminase [Oligoflexia bacterium]
MKEALKLAELASQDGEVPVGAILVGSPGEGMDPEIISKGFNRRECDHDPMAHAELLALREASKKLKRWRLTGCTLYVTLEPCLMCAGAIVLSRVDRVVYGTPDPKAGAVESLYETLKDRRLNHRPSVTSGVLKDECSVVLKEFFAKKRNTGAC